MKIARVIVIGIILLASAQRIQADGIVIADWSGSVDIPDQGEYFESYEAAGVPPEAQVTGVLLEVLIDDRGNDNFWCSDYEVKLACDTQEGPAGYHLLWDDALEKTDGDTDDDVPDDSDIELSLWTDVFNGESVGQIWYVSIADTVAFHPTFPPQNGLGCVKQIRLIVEYSRQPQRLYVDNRAKGSCDGSSWTDAFVALQDALAVVQPGDDICVAQGIYKPDRQVVMLRFGPVLASSGDRTESFRLRADVAVRGGYAGFGEPDPDARDVRLYETILSGDLNGDDGPGFAGNAENSYHVVTGSGTNETAVLDGFTVTGGNADGSSPNHRGGGMHNRSGSPRVVNCTFRDNTAHEGGGMSNGNGSSPTVINCKFNNNLALDYAGGMRNNASSPTVTNCKFNGNSASSGGGMINRSGSPTITNCIFAGNYADGIGGAMRNWYNSHPRITNCTFFGNVALLGGGVGCTNSSNPTITNCIMWNDIPREISAADSSPVINFSDIQWGWPSGVGNINLDPLFVDAAGPDTIFGTVDDQLNLWADSPCIDSGDNAQIPPDTHDLDQDGDVDERLPLDITGQSRFVDALGTVDSGVADPPQHLEIVDMGAYEFVAGPVSPPGGVNPSGSGLVALYEFDVGASDSSGNDLHGTMENGAHIVNDPQRGPVLALDGINDHVTLPISALLNPASITVSVWINPSSVDRFMDIIRNYMTYRFYMHAGGDMECLISPSSKGTTAIGCRFARISAGQWNFIACTWDARSGQWRMYMNGSETDSLDMQDNNPLTVSTSMVFIGAMDRTKGHFHGFIDDVAVYDRALSSAEILDIYNGQ